MHNQKAILFASDPPYLVDYDGTNHPSKQGWPDKNKDWSDSYAITWDDASQGPELYEEFIRQAIEHAILPNAAWYCWHASRRQAMVENVWEKYGAFVHQQIVWAKDRGILTRSYYLWQHEPCFFGWLKGNKPPRVSDDYPSTVRTLPTVKVGEKTEHPTSKPVEVFAIPMRQHTRPGEIRYEPFSGSGSQIIAGETTGRPTSDDLAVVLAARELGQPTAELAEMGDEVRLREGAERPDGCDADRFQLPCRRRTDTEDLTNRQRREEVQRLGAADDRKAAWLVEIGGELGEELVEAEADRDGDADLALDRQRNPGQQDRRRPVRPAEIGGEVEIGLVERDRLDDRCRCFQDAADLPADPLVLRHVGWNHHRIRDRAAAPGTSASPSADRNAGRRSRRW